MSRGGALGAWGAAAALLAVLPWVPGLHGDFARSLLTQMGIAAVFALSYNLLLGQAGLLSFGHAVYFGLGGYAAIHLLQAINHGLAIPLPFVPLAGALAGLAAGLVFGALTTRRAGTIFALISLGLGELVHASSLMLPSFFGGEEGVTASRTSTPPFLGLHFGSQLEVYYLTAAWLLASAALMYAFLRTPVGRLANAVRDNPERVEFIGYDPQRIRFIVFSVAALFAGLAGGLHAINYEIVASEALGATRSGAVLVMVCIGGVRHFMGAIVGAIAITWLQVSLSDYTGAWMLYLGLLFMAIVAWAPGGLAALAAMHVAAMRSTARGAIARSYVLALPFALATFAGSVVLVEMLYRRATQPGAGRQVTLFGIGMDTMSAVPWLGAAVVLAVGACGLAMIAPRVAASWASMEEAADGTA
jgi:branched-chain amino acid transport system permease protein